MGKMRRWSSRFALALAGTIVLVGLTACSSGGADGKVTATLVVSPKLTSSPTLTIAPTPAYEAEVQKDLRDLQDLIGTLVGFAFWADTGKISEEVGTAILNPSDGCLAVPSSLRLGVVDPNSIIPIPYKQLADAVAVFCSEVEATGGNADTVNQFDANVRPLYDAVKTNATFDITNMLRQRAQDRERGG